MPRIVTPLTVGAGLKIAVCIKRVPDMEMRFSIAADRKSLDPAGLKYEMGDFDGYALEVGLQLVEKAGSGEVVVISLGPDGVQETLRKGLAMGAARAVHLKADQVPFDGNRSRLEWRAVAAKQLYPAIKRRRGVRGCRIRHPCRGRGSRAELDEITALHRYKL